MEWKFYFSQTMNALYDDATYTIYIQFILNTSCVPEFVFVCQNCSLTLGTD